MKAAAPEDCVYLDETGCCLGTGPDYARSPRGQRACDGRPAMPGERMSAVAALTAKGIEAEYLYRGALTATLFVAHVETYLLALLGQGKTLVMDNLPAHRAKKVEQCLQRHNIAYLFTPPCSPEFNPIEEAFSKAKQAVRRQKPRTLAALEEALRKGLKTVTADDAINYINHSYEYVYVTDEC